MAKGVRLYDTLSIEEIEMLIPFADMAVLMLYQKMSRWKILHNAQSPKTNATSRMVAWLKYRGKLEEKNISTVNLPYWKSKSFEQKVRSEFVAEILDNILPRNLSDDDFFETGRKVLSIMSVRSWAERKKRDAENALKPQLPKVHRHSPTLPEKRAKWQDSIDHRPEVQGELLLADTKSGTTGAPITTLPPQTTIQQQNKMWREVNLGMQGIIIDADLEQKAHQDVYPKPKWFGKKKHRKYQAQD